MQLPLGEASPLPCLYWPRPWPHLLLPPSLQPRAQISSVPPAQPWSCDGEQVLLQPGAVVVGHFSGPPKSTTALRSPRQHEFWGGLASHSLHYVLPMFTVRTNWWKNISIINDENLQRDKVGKKLSESLEELDLRIFTWYILTRDVDMLCCNGYKALTFWVLTSNIIK